MDLRTKLRWDQATPIRVAGVLLVIISMFLKVLSKDDPMRGYQCAYMTLQSCFAGLREFIPTPFHQDLRTATLDVFVGVSGLINPLLLLYLLFKPTWRIPVLLLFGVLLAEAVSVFTVFRLMPGAGFFVWAIGIILILAPPYKPATVALRVPAHVS